MYDKRRPIYDKRDVYIYTYMAQKKRPINIYVCMTTETYTYVHIWQKRPIHSNRDLYIYMYMEKETSDNRRLYIVIYRSLLCRQKRPIYSNRDLYIYMYMEKETSDNRGLYI